MRFGLFDLHKFGGFYTFAVVMAGYSLYIRQACLWLAVAAAGGAAAGAQEFAPIVAEVLANNPALRADRSAAQAEVLTRVAANRPAPAEASFTYEWPTRSAYDIKRELTVEQSFDWPGAYGARRKAASQAREALRAGVAAAERSLSLEASLLLCKIVDANLRCDMLRTIVSNLDSLHGSMHTMLEQRQITELDHRKVALEEVSMKRQLTDAEAARAAALAELAALNGGSLPSGAAELRQYPAQELLPQERYISAEAPEVGSLLAEAATLKLDAKAERMALFPGFSLGYVFEHEGAAYLHGFSVGITLPSYSAKAEAASSQLRAQALEFRAEQAESARRAAIAADYVAAQRAGNLLSDYSAAFGHDYPTLLKRALVGGQLSYIEYFSELNFYLTMRLDYLSQLLTYHSLLTNLQSRL